MAPSPARCSSACFLCGVHIQRIRFRSRQTALLRCLLQQQQIGQQQDGQRSRCRRRNTPRQPTPCAISLAHHPSAGCVAKQETQAEHGHHGSIGGIGKPARRDLHQAAPSRGLKEPVADPRQREQRKAAASANRMVKKIDPPMPARKLRLPAKQVGNRSGDEFAHRVGHRARRGDEAQPHLRLAWRSRHAAPGRESDRAEPRRDWSGRSSSPSSPAPAAQWSPHASPQKRSEAWAPRCLIQEQALGSSPQRQTNTGKSLGFRSLPPAVIVSGTSLRATRGTYSQTSMSNPNFCRMR